MRVHRTLLAATVFAAFLSISPSFSQVPLQELIDQAAAGAEVRIPKGNWKEPLVVSKPLKLRGENPAESIIDVVSDSPALRIETKGEVFVEGLTIRWRRETSHRPAFVQAAVVVTDTKLTLQNVNFVAPDDKLRCPSAFTATGFSEVSMSGCEFKGFDFTIQFGDGARGTIADCVVIKPGHCGITVGNGSKLEVTGTIVTGSEFHAMRCTGGELNASGNLVIANKNRGFYLGNKAARGTIRDNAIIGNGTGISGFGGSEVEIAHNYIAQSDFAAVDMRDNCKLKVSRNAIVNNARGLVLFKESGQNHNVVAINALGGNKTETEGFEKTPDVQRVNASVPGNATGRFVLGDVEAFGLTAPEKIQALWPRYLKINQLQ